MLKNKFPLKLDIQFFADEGGATPSAGDPPAPAPGENPPAGDPPAKVELTKTELDKKIEAESDRKFEKAKAKWEKEQEAILLQTVQDELEKERKLSKLSEKERKDAELTEREKTLQKRLADIERKELKADAIADLAKKELPSEFADFLLAENAEKTLENINALKETFDAAVNAAVKEKLRQDPPRTGDGRNPSGNQLDKAEMARKARIIK